ncbi:4-carboxymuconolactone decarboxylase [Geodermatophilus marinus]|uniref:4-carboxymuconolactone decarboxylase n=1 Tax=Geodermatophilus sp. LHW52908 TaxID=2303986 RepID=UPI000E3C5256|nr:4-carboxymuconolactone decarboxylase [Geodermatophilus sp. LHW52908]RFU20385.1 4-carboxymuconolactone decarboxylase [Geodermatophilus sp. LHW52908]
MSDRPATDDTRREAGMRTRREVLGDAWVDRAVAGTTPFTAGFQDFITRVAWGDVWQRPGLSRRDRSLMTLSITVALRHWDEFALHVRAARNNGLTDEEIAEVLQHAAVYAGVPAANHAFKVAGPILDELRDAGAGSAAESPGTA